MSYAPQDRTRVERIALVACTPHKGIRFPQHSTELATNPKENNA